MGFDNVNVNVSGPVQSTSIYKTKVLKGNHSFASQVTEPNMKYVIKHNFDLGGGTVTIPENCVLEFDGGSLNNGIVNLNACDLTEDISGNAEFRNFKPISYSCKQLGLIPNDSNATSVNTKRIVNAINAGVKIICDDTYYVGYSAGITNSIDISGSGTLIANHTGATLWGIKNTNVKYVNIKGITIKRVDGGSVYFICFVKEPNITHILDYINFDNVTVEKICALQFNNRTGDTVKTVNVSSCRLLDIAYVAVDITSTNIEKVTLINNTVFNFKNMVFKFATTSADRTNLIIAEGNYISNKGYISKNTDFYTGFLIAECIDAIYKGNVMEDVIVDSETTNLYDVYIPCNRLEYTDNTKRNVIQFGDVNPLCKIKNFYGENGSKIIRDNKLIVDITDNDLPEEYAGKLETALYSMIDMDPVANIQNSVEISNNVISINGLFGWGGSSGKCRSYTIKNNYVKCKNISSNSNIVLRDSYDNMSAILENNTIETTDTEIDCTSSRVLNITGTNVSIVINNCDFKANISRSLNGGTALIRNSNFYAHNEPNTMNYMVGSIKECTYDFSASNVQNENIGFNCSELQRIDKLTIKRPPIGGGAVIGLRYILTNEYLNKSFIKFTYNGVNNTIFIDNTAKKAYLNYTEYDFSSRVNIPLTVSTGATVTVYGDRITLNKTVLLDGLVISVAPIGDELFNQELKENYSIGTYVQRPPFAIIPLGYKYYCTDFSQEMYYTKGGDNSNRWKNGAFSAALLAGTSAQRPVQDRNTDISIDDSRKRLSTVVGDLGYKYFDTTLNKTITVSYLGGISTNYAITWIEEDGAIAGTARTGLYSALPHYTEIYEGFEFMLSDNGSFYPVYAHISGSGASTKVASWFKADGTVAFWGVDNKITDINLDNKVVTPGSTYTGTFTPNEGASLPATITVKMNGTTLRTQNGEYTYNNTTGAITILGTGGTGGVTGPITISA